MSYGKRYCSIALLNIISHAPADADKDGADGNLQPAKGGGFTQVDEVPFVSGAQVEQLREVIEATGVGLNRFLTKYQVKRLHDLPANLYDPAVAACKAYQAEKAVKHG